MSISKVLNRNQTSTNLHCNLVDQVKHIMWKVSSIEFQTHNFYSRTKLCLTWVHIQISNTYRLSQNVCHLSKLITRVTQQIKLHLLGLKIVLEVILQLTAIVVLVPIELIKMMLQVKIWRMLRCSQLKLIKDSLKHWETRTWVLLPYQLLTLKIKNRFNHNSKS